ncbi:hypothetical protein UA31_03330 [Photobacterium angustum]|nr:hypothetical protein UB36_03330 [Photobacterium damselae subsp. damselae]KJG43134.1 hypothetical protein UA35_00730 [Photobacterium angustum]KJG48010.1 hypothetical protein UA31_03330 [Photobacterium angustum]KJG50211.1 hypothetical protein UA30_04860 [Photobacterium angustum]KJG54207.1 hypothetical protein UA34_07290 [Photobacterium angustum]
MATGIFAITELGLEKKCTMCGDWYPFDDEFYQSYFIKAKNRHQVKAECKACCIERYRNHLRKKPQ